jgi:hypothetical protein
MKTKMFLSLLLLATVVPVHLRLLMKPRRRLTLEAIQCSSLPLKTQQSKKSL